MYRMAFRNLLRAPRRTFISLSAIALSVGALLVFQSFVDGVRTSFRTSMIRTWYGHYKIFQKGYRENKSQEPFGYLIPNAPAVKDVLKQVGELAFVSERQEFFGLLNFGQRSLGVRGVGIHSEEERKFLTNNKIVDGTALNKDTAQGVLLGKGLSDQLAAKAGDTVTFLTQTETGSLNALDFTVTGVYQSGVKEVDEATFYIETAVAQRLLRITGVSEIMFAFTAKNELQYRETLKKQIPEKFPTLEVLHWHELAGEYFDNAMSWLEKQFYFFRVIILLIAALSIVNVFTIGLFERIGEFGTMRAMGAERSEIVLLVFLESMMQAFLGTLLGVLLGLGIIAFSFPHGITMPPPPNMSVEFGVFLEIPWQSIPFVVLLGTVIAGGTGIIPAIRFSRLNIVYALGKNL